RVVANVFAKPQNVKFAGLAVVLRCFKHFCKTSVLTETMENRPELGLDSYDRFFSNQDTLPQGGFGNLIALPLQKKPRENGNSIFLNESFKPYPDQWQYLSKIIKIGRDQVETLFENACGKGRIIGLRMPITEEDDKPWDTPPSGKKKNQIVGPFPETIQIVLANQIFIPKDDLSPSLRNALIRLAAFQNPEFYQKQAMRVDMKFNGQLYPDQKKAAKALLKHDNGILAATTAFGKTVIASYIMAKRKANTLVLVHRRQLQEQWRSRLEQFLNIDNKEIGQIGAGKRKLTGKVDIAIIQSLNRKGKVDDIVANYGHLVIDECHHISAPSFEAIARQFRGKYITGLSATVIRKDGHHPIIYMNCGPVRYRVCAKSQAKKRAFNHKLIIRNTSFELPQDLQVKEKMTISDLYAALTHHTPRNTMIAEDVMESIYNGRFPALLTERREHLEYFREIFEDRIDNLIVFKGGMGKKQLVAAQEKLNDLSEGKSSLILATGRYLGEGFDQPRLDTFF
ncbi:MAG: restriction endonuclease subunit R, partial [Planctomycetales bacterium 4572_13]